MTSVIFSSCIKDQISMYLAQLKETVTEKTFSDRTYQLSTLDKYLCDNDINDEYLSQEILSGWILSLPQLKPKTIAKYQKTVISFLKFKAALGYKTYIPSIKKTSDDYIPYFFSENEMKKIYEIIDNYPSRIPPELPFINIEFPMIVRILDGCGTRLGETIRIQMKDIDLEHGVIILRHTKKDKERLVPISDSLCEILESYCQYLGIVNSPDCFVFPKDNFSSHIEDYSIQNRFHKALILAGIITGETNDRERGPCIHCLRHRFALKACKQLEELGIRTDDSVPYLSLYLGHESLQESEKYLKNSLMQFPDQIEKYGEMVTSILPNEDIWDI